MVSYRCLQHVCQGCNRTTSQAEGVLFRCETCEGAWCHDCLPEDYADVGEQIPEFQALGKKSVPSAYFISCPTCIEISETDEKMAEWWSEQKTKAYAAIEAAEAK